jgi:single-strand DNA-binding protein
MNDTYMTVIGNVCDEPKLRVTGGGHSVANFRVASTPRRFDREKGVWVDCPTLFVNVTCWRAMAENVRDSVHKGQPIVVTGRYYSRTYEVNETVRVAYDLEANALGHDLTRGTSEFRKVTRAIGTTHVAADESGMPVDDSDHWLGVPEADHPADDDAVAVSPELVAAS